ncbi:MAG: hypothetical protein H6742_08755 [Alphaproteobacteria bacterium]|nr:hypothetical protein [Alphaproteobacteria bacterium]
MRAWEDIRRDLAGSGLNAVGVADGADWQDWLPGCRAVVVVGSGGPALWTAFHAWVQEDPRRLTHEPHPLDRFVRERLAASDAAGPGRRWVFADSAQDPPAPMQPLALAAGLGWRSRLWLVLHPDHGPWLGLRAACFTTEPLAVDGPLRGPSPCDGCPAPCAAACPGAALAGGMLDWRSCADHRAASDSCLDACHARAACPHGAASAYPPAAHAYHHDKARGRAALCAALGVDDVVGAAGIDRRG